MRELESCAIEGADSTIDYHDGLIRESEWSPPWWLYPVVLVLAVLASAIYPWGFA